MSPDTPLSRESRIKAAEAGMWQRADGRLVSIRDMVNSYLLNAYLKALQDGDPDVITTPLAEEVLRRDLMDVAYDMAAERMKVNNGK